MFLSRAYSFCVSFILRMKVKWNTICFIILYKKILGIVEGASGVIIYQKVIIKGQGKVIIGNDVQFGVPESPTYEGHFITILPRNPNSELVLGNNCIVNNNNCFVIVRQILIGNKCMTGSNCQFFDSDMHSLDPLLRHSAMDVESEGRALFLGDNVMVGANVICGPDTYVGENSVVGMGALLKRKKFPPNSIIVGNPARPIRKIKMNHD